MQVSRLQLGRLALPNRRSSYLLRHGPRHDDDLRDLGVFICKDLPLRLSLRASFSRSCSFFVIGRFESGRFTSSTYTFLFGVHQSRATKRPGLLPFLRVMEIEDTCSPMIMVRFLPASATLSIHSHVRGVTACQPGTCTNKSDGLKRSDLSWTSLVAHIRAREKWGGGAGIVVPNLPTRGNFKERNSRGPERRSEQI